MKLFFTPNTMKLLNAQAITNTCRTFISNYVKPYHKYGRYELKPLRAHNQNTSFSTYYFKKKNKTSVRSNCAHLVYRI